MDDFVVKVCGICNTEKLIDDFKMNTENVNSVILIEY